MLANTTAAATGTGKGLPDRHGTPILAPFGEERRQENQQTENHRGVGKKPTNGLGRERSVSVHIRVFPYSAWDTPPWRGEPAGRMDRDQNLREQLAQTLEQTRILHDRRVASAVRTVPRHRFLPQLSLEDAYADRAVAVKESEGVILSSISQPGMIVQMLELLEVAPGSRVLEVGTGTGYNAALLAHLVGDRGSVITVDIDADMVAQASATLHALRFDRVEARLGDGHERIDDLLFDRIIVSARANDIEAAWWDELRDGGRIVIPLDIGFGGERAIGFVRRGSRLESTGSYPCSFITLRGEDTRDGDIFFRAKVLRYEPPSQHRPMQIVAVRRTDADASLLESADAVVARPTTLFAVSLG